jgi:hypothetical protein
MGLKAASGGAKKHAPKDRKIDLHLQYAEERTSRLSAPYAPPALVPAAAPLRSVAHERLASPPAVTRPRQSLLTSANAAVQALSALGFGMKPDARTANRLPQFRQRNRPRATKYLLTLIPSGGGTPAPNQSNRAPAQPAQYGNREGLGNTRQGHAERDFSEVAPIELAPSRLVGVGAGAHSQSIAFAWGDVMRFATAGARVPASRFCR